MVNSRHRCGWTDTVHRVCAQLSTICSACCASVGECTVLAADVADLAIIGREVVIIVRRTVTGGRVDAIGEAVDAG